MQTESTSNINEARKPRQTFSGYSHLAGAAVSLLGWLYLFLSAQGNPTAILAYSIYGFSLALLFSASAVYHLAKTPRKTTLWLRKLDHAAIYFLIAGTYTPICQLLFSGFWQRGFLWIIWGIALAGVALKLLVIQTPRWLTAGTYLVMGWLSILAIGEMLHSLPTAGLVWLIGGGVFYSLGALVYITKKMDFRPGVFGFHEVWHLFVLAGAACHFIVIAGYTG